MPKDVQELRPKPPETEKITINLGFVDLGHVDLMVKDGFYSNRTDFIRTAIRNQLGRHAEVVSRSVARNTLDLGLRHYTRADLTAVAAGNANVHDWKHFAFDYLKNVDAGGRAAKAERWDKVVGVFADSDRIEFFVAGDHRLI